MNNNTKILVIIPTYDEVENIQKLIPLVLVQDPRIGVLVIDDGSPDGTAEQVEKMMAKTDHRLHLIKRPRKMGLGTAYVDGFKYALKERYDLIFEMDADFSHDPDAIPEFLKTIEDYDLVVGSRYIRGVNVINWPMSRLILSWLANFYTRVVTGLPLKDATSGYKCFKRNVLEAIDLDNVHSDGYAFQIEIDFKVWQKGFRLKEIPIVFIDRYIGISKMNRKIIREAVWMVWKLRLLSLFGKL
ncbi:polyprenol monophosphomannose synthase [bacterium]|nr:polyprenol monophosphomannose synthase [bacterium]RQV92076.1 MAG: polyprenol monophosphomannose synthase [bacterium]